MSPKLIAISKLTAIRLISIALQFYAIIFLYFFGELASVGVYSAITATIAPITMFCSFRYIEWISASKDISNAFSVSLSAGILLFIPLSTISLFAAHSFGVDLHLTLALLMYKPMEMASDFLGSSLVASNNTGQALRLSAIKTTTIILLSLLGVFYSPTEPIWVIAISFAVGTLGCFILIDVPTALRQGIWQTPSKTELLSYLTQNIRYGFLSLIVSINSVLPRYLISAIGDMRSLGLFTIAYQVSATLTNIVQYPISHKATTINSYIQRTPHALLKMCTVLAALLVCYLLIAYVSGKSTGLPSEFNHYIVPASSLLMALALIARGTLISTSIAIGLGTYTPHVVVASIIGASAIHAFSMSILNINNTFLLGVIFTFSSSLITACALTQLHHIKHHTQ